jgi:colanic acid biosynthesis glycosyl transferase WcaI
VFKILTLPRQDVVITLTTPPLIAWAGLLHKRLRGGRGSRRTKLILWNMDCYPDVAERAGVMKPGGLAARFVRARTRAIFRGLDHLVCLDTAMAELLCTQYARANPSLPVSIIPNWEEAAFFTAGSEPDASAFYNTLPIGGRAVVLYLGNMGYGHSFDTVLNAAQALRDRPVVFLFVGGGRMWQQVKDEADRRGLGNVLMHPYISKEQTLQVMAGGICALVTLRDDALGVMSPSKIHSNLAMGLPLAYVGPAGSNVDDAITGHNCGVSLRHGDAAGLVQFVDRMLADPEERAAMRERARRAFETAYCDLATMPRFDSVIAHATTGRSEIQDIPARTAAEHARSARSEITGAARPPRERAPAMPETVGSAG